MLRLATLLVIVALGAARLGAQSPAATPPDGSQQAVAHDADPVAAGLAALDSVARWQRGDTPRRAPTSLHAKFTASYRNEQGTLAQAEIERWYVREPERILTRTTEQVTGLTTTVGWDGTTLWFRDDKKGTVLDYGARPETHMADFDTLHQQTRLTRLLLEALVMDALRPRLSEVRLAGRQQLKDLDGQPHDLLLVQASAPDELTEPDPHAPPTVSDTPPAPLTLTFGIDAHDGALWSLQVRAPGRDDYALRFDLHGRTRDGLRVPGNIQVFRAGATEPESKLGVEEDDGHELLLDLDATIDAALFAMPAPAAGH